MAEEGGAGDEQVDEHQLEPVEVLRGHEHPHELQTVQLAQHNNALVRRRRGGQPLAKWVGPYVRVRGSGVVGGDHLEREQDRREANSARVVGACVVCVCVCVR
mgnify:CR=1 FL=1